MCPRRYRRARIAGCHDAQRRRQHARHRAHEASLPLRGCPVGVPIVVIKPRNACAGVLCGTSITDASRRRTRPTELSSSDDAPVQRQQHDRRGTRHRRCRGISFVNTSGPHASSATCVRTYCCVCVTMLQHRAQFTRCTTWAAAVRWRAHIR
jgi:hypothetical protein